MIFVETRC